MFRIAWVAWFLFSLFHVCPATAQQPGFTRRDGSSHSHRERQLPLHGAHKKHATRSRLPAREVEQPLHQQHARAVSGFEPLSAASSASASAASEADSEPELLSMRQGLGMANLAQSPSNSEAAPSVESAGGLTLVRRQAGGGFGEFFEPLMDGSNGDQGAAGAGAAAAAAAPAADGGQAVTIDLDGAGNVDVNGDGDVGDTQDGVIDPNPDLMNGFFGSAVQAASTTMSRAVQDTQAAETQVEQPPPATETQPPLPEETQLEAPPPPEETQSEALSPPEKTSEEAPPPPEESSEAPPQPEESEAQKTEQQDEEQVASVESTLEVNEAAANTPPVDMMSSMEQSEEQVTTSTELELSESLTSSAAEASGTAQAEEDNQEEDDEEEEDEEFQLPGRQLQVLPIGLGVFAGVSVIALAVVGLVTYERKKYRKQYRERKDQEAVNQNAESGRMRETSV